jgi:hypothetical protein
VGGLEIRPYAAEDGDSYPFPSACSVSAIVLTIGCTNAHLKPTEAGRYVLLVFTLRARADGTFIRPISARYMHAKEVKYDETEAAEAEKR